MVARNTAVAVGEVDDARPTPRFRVRRLRARAANALDADARGVGAGNAASSAPGRTGASPSAITRLRRCGRPRGSDQTRAPARGRQPPRPRGRPVSSRPSSGSFGVPSVMRLLGKRAWCLPEGPAWRLWIDGGVGRVVGDRIKNQDDASEMTVGERDHRRESEDERPQDDVQPERRAGWRRRPRRRSGLNIRPGRMRQPHPMQPRAHGALRPPATRAHPRGRRHRRRREGHEDRQRGEAGSSASANAHSAPWAGGRRPPDADRMTTDSMTSPVGR